ncbi:MAG: hypothetical protein EOO06_00620 [Chitinophagaceae bacterium]|nr:MAG: hypothetical protein EOO06_00620 [Chitinophagaceae bacterium]
MKKGKVTSDILTYAGTAASQRANAGGALDSASRASQAEQARYQNSVNDLAVVASNAGVEEGFARIFRTLTAGLSESNTLVEKLAEGFNEATKWADDLLLFPQSFARALEGKDSLVGDWLGAESLAQLKSDWTNVKQIFTDISSIKFDFLPTLEATAKEIAAIMNAISQFQQWKNNLVASPSQEQDASFMSQPITWAYQQTGKFFNGIGEGLDASRERGTAVFDDPNSYWKGKPEAYDDNKSNMADMLASLKESQRDNAMTTQVSLTINVDPQTLANMDIAAQAQDLGNSIAVMFEQANVNFPIRE